MYMLWRPRQQTRYLITAVQTIIRHLSGAWGLASYLATQNALGLMHDITRANMGQEEYLVVYMLIGILHIRSAEPAKLEVTWRTLPLEDPLPPSDYTCAYRGV